MARCISCRSDIIDFVQERFEGFQVTLPLPDLKQDNFYHTYDPKYKELNGSIHCFVKERPEGSFCHLEVRRAFAREKIYLQLGNVIKLTNKFQKKEKKPLTKAKKCAARP